MKCVRCCRDVGGEGKATSWANTGALVAMLPSAKLGYFILRIITG